MSDVMSTSDALGEVMFFTLAIAVAYFGYAGPLFYAPIILIPANVALILLICQNNVPISAQTIVFYAITISITIVYLSWIIRLHRRSVEWIFLRVVLRLLPAVGILMIDLQANPYAFVIYASAVVFSNISMLKSLYNLITGRKKFYGFSGHVSLLIIIFLDVATCLLCYAKLFAEFGIRVGSDWDKHSDIISNNLIDTLYLSVVTWTTLGYGDFSPINTKGRIVSAAEAINGYLVMAVIVVGLQALFTLLNHVQPPASKAEDEDKVFFDAS
ncbi:two pore domain potassium channel family protein [Rhizobium tropici]|uniref:Two pore domain potassium channel family protein n=1 Tax=Rhizobium tropici TaxID=398 RepID=A0A5B0VQM8_RHITR|nr:potassium channel family protein [Rhizobium tropici]KAA1177002.1 two pore domain potassium channel family protein [Rhizobium tropici]